MNEQSKQVLWLLAVLELVRDDMDAAISNNDTQEAARLLEHLCAVAALVDYFNARSKLPQLRIFS